MWGKAVKHTFSIFYTVIKHRFFTYHSAHRVFLDPTNEPKLLLLLSLSLLLLLLFDLQPATCNLQITPSIKIEDFIQFNLSQSKKNLQIFSYNIS